MSYIKNIILEEHQRLQDLSKKYNNIVASFPKGTISIKKRNKKEYLYLAIRQGGKLKFNYIGAVTSDKAIETLDQINLRKQYEDKLKQVKNDLKEIGRVVRGKKI